MGQASGHAEMLEIEGPDLPQKLGTLFRHAARWDDLDLGATDLLMRVYNGCSEESAGGGLHMFLRRTDGPVPGNTKLAMGDGKVITETRGEGGFVIVWPTPARTGHDPDAVYMMLPDSSPAATAEVTGEELEFLHHLFSEAFGGMPETPEPEPRNTAPSITQATSGISPFDDYRERATWRDILEPAGWTWHSKDATHDYWTRPGKDKRDGQSASTIEDGPFYLFSSSVTGMPIETGLSKGQVYAHLHHGGDLSAATKALRDNGYGDPLYVLPSWNPEATVSQEFWDAHPTLAAIKQAAHARIVSADAVLACILARVVQHIPYQYALPPIVGGRSSPNLYVALIGPSGTGKGGARRAADELLAISRAPHPTNEGPLGSGEGIVSLFYGNPPKDPDDPDSKLSKDLEFMYRGVMLLDEEGSALAELLRRQGQVLEPVLLKMWSGESLGMSYSLRSSAVQLSVKAEEYRAAALLGIQPGAAAFLLDDERVDRGLPQRFLWASTIDPTVPDRPEAFPEPLHWQPPRFDRSSLTGTLVTVHDDIKRDLIRAQLHRVRGLGSLGVDAHAGLVRLKTATALAALLHPGEPLAVDLDVWDLAGHLKEASDQVRLAVKRQAQEERERVQEARQAVAVRQRVAVGQVDSQVKNCARSIQRHIEKRHPQEGDYCKPSCARRSLKSKDRDLFEAAIAKAQDLEWVLDNSTDDDDVPHFILGPSRPA